ncbi:MAG TPA: biopolymer transporter ExbD [Nevskiaceae bacterium]|nr:biopolymer transporter ExbD [Nevskiaceae bacterium]
MRLKTSGRTRNTALDMVPMVNFAFLLLIFFLMIGVRAGRDTLVNPPASTPRVNWQQEREALTLLADGRLYWRDQPLQAAQLPGLVSQWGREYPGEPLPLAADAAADANQVVAVLEGLRAAGLGQIRLITVNRR